MAQCLFYFFLCRFIRIGNLWSLVTSKCTCSGHQMKYSSFDTGKLDSDGRCHVICYPRGPLTYFTDGGRVRGFFWVWHFGWKGFFWVYERCNDFFGLQKNNRDFFLSIVFSSPQINNNINTSYCWCGIFWGMLKKVGIFWGRQILKLEFFWV